MPADNIARAVKRGAGAEDGAANYEDIVYEGYAPAGVGLIIECLTDNRNRAAAEVRSTLTKGNGSLATSGSVSFNFERKGQIVVPSEGVDFDKLFETAAEAGAEDVTDDGEVFTVVTGPSDLFTVRKALQEAGFDYDSADQVMQPKNEVEPASTAGFRLFTWTWCGPHRISPRICVYWPSTTACPRKWTDSRRTRYLSSVCSPNPTATPYSVPHRPPASPCSPPRNAIFPWRCIRLPKPSWLSPVTGRRRRFRWSVW